MNTAPAVQTYLQSNSTPSSHEAALQQMITNSLATLLTELEALTKATLLELADPLTEFMQELTKGSQKNREEIRSQIATESNFVKDPTSSPSQTSQTSQAAKLSEDPPATSTTSQPTSYPTDSARVDLSSSARQAREFEKAFSALPHKLSERTSSKTETRQTLASSPPFVESTPDMGKLSGGRHTVENPIGLLSNPKIEPRPTEQRVIIQGPSTPSSGIPLEPEMQYQRTSPATDRTAVALGPKVNLATIVSMRDLIRSLLSQPGALQNQLEPGVFKALMSALSDEAALLLVDPQPRASTVDPSGQKSGGHLLAKQLDMTSRPSGSNASAGDKTPEPLYATKSQPPKLSHAHGGLAATIQSAPVLTSTSEGLNAQNLSGASILLSPSVQHPPIPKLSFGVLSDHALLAALQGAALRRNYSDVLKRRKRPTPQGSPQHSRGERDNSFNDASRESTGLSLLRAFLEQRAPKTGTLI